MTTMMLYMLILVGCSGNARVEKNPPEDTRLDKVGGQSESSDISAGDSPKEEPAEQALVQFQLFYTDVGNFQQGTEPFLRPVFRSAEKQDLLQHSLDMLYQGPSKEEEGLRLTSCQSTGARILTVDEGLAVVRLEGGCGGCGTHSVLDSIVATLQQFPTVSSIVLQDPSGRSEDGRPPCLEP